VKEKPRTLEQIRIAGLCALRRELGPVDTERFLHQFETGSGDYTEERRLWRDQWTMDEIVAELDQHRHHKNSS
jgi:hypothetical protein